MLLIFILFINIIISQDIECEEGTYFNEKTNECQSCKYYKEYYYYFIELYIVKNLNHLFFFS